MSALDRSNRADVRNPITALPAARDLCALDPAARAALRKTMRDLSAQCRAKADECWRKHKAPMAAYWKAQAVYARHISVLLGSAP
jgi:hypothetical protein